MSATTVYEVITRYKTEDHASGAMRSYTRTAEEVDRVNRRAGQSFGLLGGTLGGLARSLGPLAAGFTAYSAFARTFENLRSAQEGAIGMAAQFAQIFRFAEDPIANFAGNLGLARDFMKDLTTDAAKLPGELRDFQIAAGAMSFQVLGGGGNLEQLRRMTQNLSIVSRAAQQSMPDAGNQAQRILLGTASVGDNPLFAFLQPIIGLTTEQFNASTAAERLRRFSDALERFGGNPALRSEVMHTFSTQWSTLMDNLFGVSGALGELGKEPFLDLTTALEGLNSFLESHRDRFKAFADSFGGTNAMDGIRTRGGSFLDNPLTSIFGSVANEIQTQNRQAAIDNEALRRFVRDTKANSVVSGLLGPTLAMPGATLDRYRKEIESDLRSVAVNRARDTNLDFFTKRKEPPRVNTGRSGDIVNNTITIMVDLKSDDSPEAIAVKIGKAMDRVSRYPTRALRTPNLSPRAGTLD